MGSGGIILSGGLNTRMGTNKAFLQLNHTSFLEKITEELSKSVEEIIVVTNTPNLYGNLDAKVITDIIPQRGPLSGIHAGLVNSNHDYNFVVACDMPFISGELVRYMLDKAQGYDVLVPRIDKYLQPLHAVYKKSCIEAIEKAFQSDVRKIDGFYEYVNVGYVTAEEINQFVEDSKVFFNVNTPEDLKEAKMIAGEARDE